MMNKKAESLVIKLSLASAVLLIIFLAGTILALENSKTYNSETKTVIIKNAQSEDIAKITLNTPLVYSVIRGKDRKVAEFTIESFEDYNNAFNDLEFYDIKNNMQKFDRTFKYKYKSYESINVSDYETICNKIEKNDGNGTYIEYSNCYRNRTGSHIEEKEVWNDFNEQTLLPEGNITLGIFTDVLPGDKVEWIPTFFNIEINEWAEWTESLSNGTVAYWKLDETSGIEAEDNIENYNLTGGTSVNWTTTGKINGAFSKDDSGYKLNNTIFGSQPKFTNGTDITVSLWVYYNVAPTNQMRFFNLQTAPGGGDLDRFSIGSDSANDFRLIANGQGAGVIFLNGGYIVQGEWYHIVARWEGSNVSLHINGTTVNSGSVASKWGYSASYEPLSLGYGETYTAFRGKVDEVGIWNRSLSLSEISNLYNEGLGISYTIDATPPNVTINAPSNTTYTSNSITFNATALDGTRVSSCWASIDSGVTNLTLQNTTAVADYTGTNSSVPDGSYTAHFYCNDTLNNLNNSESVEFTINTPPSIPSLLAPENTTGYPLGSTITFVWANSTDSGGDTINYELEIYNESDMSVVHRVYLNNSIAEKVGNTSINVTLSSYINVDDDYYWRVRANDSVSASNWSTARHFQYANWTIVFNLTDSYTGEQIDTSNSKDNFDISCDNGFIVSNVENPYTATNLGVGVIECTFSDLTTNSGYTLYRDMTLNISMDNDTLMEVPMSLSGGLTPEEHTWLEAIYECIINQDCDLYNLLLGINSTVGNIWEHTEPTDGSVITSENITNKIVNSTNNLTIDYTISIPVKAGYITGTYLPIRIGYWFLNESNTTCYNQGEQPVDVEGPYCQPLIIETLGPMGGSIDFTVELSPSLPAGNYSIKRIVDIDPNNIWINYGQEAIGMFMVTESLVNPSIGLEKTGERIPSTQTPNSETGDSGGSSGSSSVTKVYNTYVINKEDDKGQEESEISNTGKVGITGAVIGTLLSDNKIFLIISILCITFIFFITIRYKTISIKKK